MKKLICVLLVIACVAALAIASADSKGSPTGGDLTGATVETETSGRDSTYVPAKVVPQTPAVTAEITEVSDPTLTKVVEETGQNPPGYFSQVTPEVGEDDEVNEVVELHLYNYQPGSGPVTLNLRFETPYEAGTRVVVMIGVADANGNIVWKAFSGVAQADGSVTVTVDEQTAVAVAKDKALVAIINK